MNTSNERISHIRQNRLILKLVFSIILAGALIFLLFYGREWLAINDQRNSLQKLSQKLIAYHEKNQSWPTNKEFLQFDFYSRKVSLDVLVYNIENILPDSPSDSVLVYAPELKLRYYPDIHPIILLDGKIDMVSAQELQELLSQTSQFYHSNSLKLQPTP